MIRYRWLNECIVVSIILWLLIADRQISMNESLFRMLVDYKSEIIRLRAHVRKLEGELDSERWFSRGVIEENERLRDEMDF